MKWIITVAIAAGLSTVIGVTPALGQEQTDLERRQEMLRKAYEDSPSVKNCQLLPGNWKLGDVFKIVGPNGQLSVRTSLPAFPAGAIRARAVIEDLPGITILTLSGWQKEGPPLQLSITAVNYSNPKAQQITTSLTWSNQNLSFNRSTVFPDGMSQTIAFVIGPNSVPTPEGMAAGVRLIVQRRNVNNLPPTNINATAPDINTLRRQHATEVGESLQPLLRELHCESLLAVDADLAWQVFADEWKLDPKVEAEVKALLPALDADEFVKREAACKQLQSMGREVSLVLTHLDRSKCTEQQNAMLDTVLSAHQGMSAKDAERFKSDKNFLLDCLYVEEPQIREAALKSLSKLVNENIDFDVKADWDKRVTAIETIRKKLVPATNP